MIQPDRQLDFKFRWSVVPTVTAMTLMVSNSSLSVVLLEHSVYFGEGTTLSSEAYLNQLDKWIYLIVLTHCKTLRRWLNAEITGSFRSKRLTWIAGKLAVNGKLNAIHLYRKVHGKQTQCIILIIISLNIKWFNNGVLSFIQSFEAICLLFRDLQILTDLLNVLSETINNLRLCRFTVGSPFLNKLVWWGKLLYRFENSIESG